MKKTFFFAMLLLMLTGQAYARTLVGTQGDVLRVPCPSEIADVVEVKAFGKNWPVYMHEGQQVAWIGIHLNTEPKQYPLLWRAGKKSWQDTIEVKKGEFRISHIQVEKKMATFDEATLKRIRADQQAIRKAYRIKTQVNHQWPEMIAPAPGDISTPFAAQRYVNGKPRSPHSGIDIVATTGTPVVAPLAGKVLLVADMYLNGTLVAIGHGNGITTVYAHLNKSLVKEGDILKQGDVFAEVGSSGRSTGPHLHWGVHFSGAKINPLSMLGR